ncbi:hypothetical protein G6F43_003780 [Rhizopus delemar]|nr:hypothetical protein G6F43_003780 [Rhizopus delemar]
MEKTRKEFRELKKNMNHLMEEMDNLSFNLKTSKERVFEIEQDLTTREEVNVDLQVLLENAIQTQKESDTDAQQTMRNAYARLVSVMHENNRLQAKLSTLEHHQKRQQGSVYDITQKMQEYTKMLEQAQGTIQFLQTSSSRTTSIPSLDDAFETGSVQSLSLASSIHLIKKIEFQARASPSFQ